MASRASLPAAALILLAGALFLTLPTVSAQLPLTPDATEYLAIGQALAEGRGFVDPISFSYYLPDPRPPIPGGVSRAPVLPLLLAVPWALGANLGQVVLLHAVWCALIGVAGALLATRLAGALAGAVFGVGFGWSFAWIAVSVLPLTEATAVGVLLSVVALAPRALRSVPAALLLAVATVVAWLTRPNLGIAVPAVVLAFALELGPRAALRSLPLWSYVVGFVALQQGLHWTFVAATGTALYAHYGLLAEILDFGDVLRFQYEYPGALPFLGSHAGILLERALQNVGVLAHGLLWKPDYHFVGWLAAPALLHALLGWGDPRTRVARRVIGFLALGFLCLCIATWSHFDWRRYAVPAGACLWLAVACWVVAMARRLATRLTAGRSPTSTRQIAFATGAAPIALVLAVFAFGSAPGLVEVSLRHLGEPPSVIPKSMKTAAGRSARRFCPFFEADATISAVDPWSIHLACGHAASVLAVDLEDEAWIRRYLETMTPQWIVASRHARFRALSESPSLERVAQIDGHVLYRVVGVDATPKPWKALPPLIHTGRSGATLRTE